MAVHQYIGARYVPYYYENSLDPTSTEWEPNVHYEALTVVTLPNLHSYISKKDVPDTVGSPALNADYWLDTGSDNAYIQDLQYQIDALDLTVGQHTTDIATLTTEVNSLIRKKALMLADSYGAYQNSGGQNMAQVAASLSGVPTDFLHIGGCGFVSDGTNTFLALISAYTGNVNAITDIVVCGGANDYSYLTSESRLISAIGTFCTYCKNTFPNLKRIVLLANSIVFGPFPNYKGAFDRVFTAHAYQMGANQNGAIFVTNSQYIMHDTRLMISDLCHPNTTGVDVLGAYLSQVLQGADSINVSRVYQGDNMITLSSAMTALGASMPTTYSTRIYRQNSTARMSGDAGNFGFLNVKTTANIPANVTTVLGTMAETLVDFYDNNNNGWLGVEGRIYTQSDHAVNHTAKGTMFVMIEGKTIKFILVYDTAAYSCYGFLPDTGSLIVSGD